LQQTTHDRIRCNSSLKKSPAFVKISSICSEGKEGEETNWNDKIPSNLPIKHHPRHHHPLLTLASCSERSSFWAHSVRFTKTQTPARKEAGKLFSDLLLLRLPAAIVLTPPCPTQLTRNFSRHSLVSPNLPAQFQVNGSLERVNKTPNQKSRKDFSSCSSLLKRLKGALAQIACSKCLIWRRSSM
jgi:hypothetical protein